MSDLPFTPVRQIQPPRSSARPRTCSFCGRDRSNEIRLITGPDEAICSLCVFACSQLLSDPAPAPALVVREDNLPA